MTDKTCDRCNTERSEYLITTQHDGTDLCYVCVNEINAQISADAAAARKAAPRCECCKRRGTWTVSGVLLCGVHKKRVQANRLKQTADWGIIGLLGAAPLTREQILELAS